MRISIDQYKLTGFKGEYFHKGEYFPNSEDGQSLDNKPFLKGYKSVLTSKSSEETMVGIKLVTQTLVCSPKIKNYLNSIFFSNFYIYIFLIIYNFLNFQANLARWEWQYRFGFKHPWKQYVKVGALTRECAYKIEALNSYFNFEFQVNHY